MYMVSTTAHALYCIHVHGEHHCTYALYCIHVHGEHHCTCTVLHTCEYNTKKSVSALSQPVHVQWRLPLQTWGLHKTLTFKDSLKPLLLKALKFVGRSEVNEATVYLGLLGRPELEEWLEEVGGELGSESSSVKLPKPLSRMVSFSSGHLAPDSVTSAALCSLAWSLAGLGTVLWPAAACNWRPPSTTRTWSLNWIQRHTPQKGEKRAPL